MPQDDTYLYHITHVDNLASVLASGCLISKALLDKRSVPYADIAHGQIQDIRASTAVPVGAKGTLHDYVPLYFAPRSPMLCAIWKGNVAGYAGGQAAIAHLVFSANSIRDSGVDFCFTDGHAVKVITEFFTDFADLNKVDWSIMKEQYWRDTDEDPDRKRRRQAEFLVRERLITEHLLGVGVMDEDVRASVEKKMVDAGCDHPVKAFRDWYY